MTTYSGSHGAALIGTKEAVNLTEWSLEVNLDTEEMTCHGDGGWKTKMYTMNNWSATISGNFDTAGLTTMTGQQDFMNNILGLGTSLEPTEISLSLYIDKTEGTLKYYKGDCYPSNYSIKAAADGVVTVEMQVKGNGLLTYLEA